MGIYIVERVCAGATMEQLANTQRAVIATSLRFTARGEPIHHIRTIYIPDKGRCLCLFEALDLQVVKDLNEVARVPYVRVMEALEIIPEE